MRIITACLLFAAPLVANAAVYKCEQQDGRIAYQQTPCAGSSSQDNRLRVFDNAVSNVAPKGPAAQGASDFPQPSLSFTGPVHDQLLQIGAIADYTSTRATECSVSLKFNDITRFKACNEMAALTGAGGRFTQAGDQFQQLQKSGQLTDSEVPAGFFSSLRIDTDRIRETQVLLRTYAGQ